MVFNSELAKKYSTDNVDGYLYYQNYIAVCLFNEGNILYIPDLIVKNRLMPSGYFGTAEIEKSKHTIPGQRSIESSIHQMKNFFLCAKYCQSVINFKFETELKKIASAYSLPLLSYHIDKGIIEFINYAFRLKKIGYGGIFFYMYIFSLVVLGKKLTFNFMQFFKKLFGYTIKLI